MHDSCRVGQPLGAHIQGDADLSGNTPQPVQVRAYPETRILAKHRGDSVWQNVADISAAHPGPVVGGTARADTQGGRRDQRGTRGSSMESIRGPHDKLMGKYRIARR